MKTNINTQNKRPPKVDRAGFDTESLRSTCLAKLAELENQENELLKTDIKGLYTTLKSEPKYSLDWLHTYLSIYIYELDYEFIKNWKNYWTMLGELEPKPKKSNGFNDDDIQKAREYPVEDLVGGSFRTFGGKKKLLCPFHEERTPSFVIYPDNSFHCFGCHIHGANAIDYLTKKDNLSFKEAVNYLNG